MFALTRFALVATLLAGCSGKEPPEEDTGGDSGPVDSDGDGSPADVDCDDAEATVFPGAEELCNDRDDDCDGDLDEDAVDQVTLYADTDGDGAGDASAPLAGCDAPAGYVATSDDCDDADDAVNPSAQEVCDAADVDENCNGTADDADATVDLSTGSTWYTDADGDGHGDAAAPFVTCDPVEGRAALADDCDDTNAAIHPDAVEICDELDTDEDCSGAADDADAGVDLTTAFDWFQDADGDSFGAAEVSLRTCEWPEGYVEDATDCDDTRIDVSPVSLEVCDDADTDEDCNGAADERGALGELTWYADADGDSQGDAAVPLDACDQPDAYVADASDCDDASASVYTGAPELCDGMSNDCVLADTWTTENEIGVASWVDADGAWSAVTDTLRAGTSEAPVAWSAPDDGELHLCEGTWYAQIDASGATLSLSGRGGSATTILDGGGTGTVLASTGGALTVSGVTLQNGAGTNGGGLYCLASELFVEDSVIQASDATSSGGGVFLQSCPDATFVGVTLADNAANFGGGLYATTSDGLMLEGLEVTGNAASVVGGGLSLSNTDFSVADSNVRGNSAGGSYAAGGISIASSTGTLDGVTVSGNTAASGAGVLVSVSTVDIVGGEISGNTAANHGAALHAYYTSTVSVSGTTFSGNVSGSDSPVYLATNTSGTFTSCVFSTNEGAESGVFGFEGTSSASVVTSDFTDNTPNDAYAAGNAYTFGLAASVTCDDATGCY